MSEIEGSRTIEPNQETIIPLHIFRGGYAPFRGSEEAAGLDVMARAIVDPLSRPTHDNPLRKSLADFYKKRDWEEKIDENYRGWIRDDPEGRDDHYGLAIPPKEQIAIGLGFAVAMKTKQHEGMFYALYERSGLPIKGIHIVNDASIVDADYRGEAMALLRNESAEDFVIGRGLRVAQIIFQKFIKPTFEVVDNLGELALTKRGVRGIGSTGLGAPRIHRLSGESSSIDVDIKSLSADYDEILEASSMPPEYKKPYKTKTDNTQPLPDYPFTNKSITDGGRKRT